MKKSTIIKIDFPGSKVDIDLKKLARDFLRKNNLPPGRVIQNRKRLKVYGPRGSYELSISSPRIPKEYNPDPEGALGYSPVIGNPDNYAHTAEARYVLTGRIQEKRVHLEAVVTET